MPIMVIMVVVLLVELLFFLVILDHVVEVVDCGYKVLMIMEESLVEQVVD